jgi:hypothetical protein
MEVFQYEKTVKFTFETKALAEEFIKGVKTAIYKYDVVTYNDVLRLAKRMPTSTNGLQVGYAKKDILKVRAVKVDNVWTVYLPTPGKMIRGVGGHSTTEDKGGA